MPKFGHRMVSAAAAVLALCFSYLPNADGRQQRSGDGGGGVHASSQTSLYVHNPSNMGVYCILTVNSPASITNIGVNNNYTWSTPLGPPLPTPSAPSASNLYYTCPACPNLTQGFFYMPKGAKVSITSNLAGNVLDGVSIAFLQPPDTCPGSTSGFYPYGAQPQITATNGTNFAEVTLNVSSNETVDISCNNGANAKINVTSAGGPSWLVNGTTMKAFTATNSYVNGATGEDNNCGISGVFPYQFTQCTAGPNACPSCPANISCTAGSPNNGPCEFTRTAGQSGGTVFVRFMGPEHPPH